MVLYHASKKENRNSILSNGLLVGCKNSGYGKKPKHRAIYLYSEDNKTVVEDLLLLWGEFDIFEVNFYDLKQSMLESDEDSYENTWQESLKRRGTVAYKGNIDKKSVKYNRSVFYRDDISYSY